MSMRCKIGTVLFGLLIVLTGISVSSAKDKSVTGDAVTQLVVRDSIGDIFGAYSASPDYFSSYFVVWIPFQGRAIAIKGYPYNGATFFSYGGGLYFTDANCSGQGYVVPSAGVGDPPIIDTGVVVDGMIYAGDASAVPQSMTLVSYQSFDSVCRSISSPLVRDAVPAVFVLNIADDFVPPFKIGF